MTSRIKLVIFDWAGTVVDHGCFAPLAAFTQLFAAHGVGVTMAQARAPMGLEKRDHIRAMLNDADVAAAWKSAHGCDWAEADVDMLYREFVPVQMAALDAHAELVPGALDTLDLLKRRGIKTAGTTGYFEIAARRIEELAASQGFKLDANAWGGPGQAGRPAPWMIYKNMEALSIYPPSSVLKIGDTLHDIAEGLNAGATSVGVLRASSDIGLNQADYDALDETERSDRLESAAQKMRVAGAHYVIESLKELRNLLG
jgi:phosphonoacetaldehyde hydrolase